MKDHQRNRSRPHNGLCCLGSLASCGRVARPKASFGLVISSFSLAGSGDVRERLKSVIASTYRCGMFRGPRRPRRFSFRALGFPIRLHILRGNVREFDNLIARDAYRGLFKAQRLPKSNFPLRYNVAPTDQIPIVRIDPRDGEREVVMARWGLIPFWMKEKPKAPRINARAERCTSCRCFAKVLLSGDVSFQRLAFKTSGRSVKVASSLIASAVKTLSLSPSRVSGSLHD